MDVGRHRPPSRRAETSGGAHVRDAGSGHRRAPGDRGPCRGARQPRGGTGKRGAAEDSHLAHLARRRGPARSLRARRRSVSPRPVRFPLHASDENTGGRSQRAPLPRRPPRRLRSGQRPLGAGSRHEGRKTPDLRRRAGDPQRRPLVRLLGGDLPPRRRRLLVVGRFAGDRVSPKRRVRRRRRHVHELRARRAAGDHAALPAGRPPQSHRPSRHRRPDLRHDALDGRAASGLRVHHRPGVAARQPRHRRPDDQSRPGPARPAALRPLRRDPADPDGSRSRVGEPEGDRLPRGRPRDPRLLRARRVDAPLPLQDGRHARRTGDARRLVRARPVRVLRRADGLGLRRRGRRVGLLHGDGEVADRAASLPRPPRRHGPEAPDAGARRPPCHVQPEPALVPRRVFEPHDTAIAFAARGRRPPAGGRLTAPDRSARAVSASELRDANDPGGRRLSAPGTRAAGARLRRLRPPSRGSPRVWRDGRPARQGRLGPQLPLRSVPRPAGLRRRVDRSPRGHGGIEDDREPLAAGRMGRARSRAISSTE